MEQGKTFHHWTKKQIVFLSLFFFVFILAICTKNSADAFQVYAVDEAGEKIYGFERDSDGITYLFLPSTLELSDVVIHYAGNVKSVSKGDLDIEMGTVSNAFAASGDGVDFLTKTGRKFSVVALQSSLPSVQIYLNSATLDMIHSNKDEKYPYNSMIIRDPTGKYDFCAENTVEIKGRGNSSWELYDKKGYQLNFEEDVSLIGCEKARKWVLLANASDDSLMRNQLVFQMAKKMEMDFVPAFEYVDLWMDGEYLGTYLLGEKVEIGTSRLNLTNENGTLFERDEAFYFEEENWFYSHSMQRHFVVKDSVSEEQTAIVKAMKDLEAALDGLMFYLYTTPPKSIAIESLSTMIDVDSFVKYYLINEYVLNCESFSTSFFWYKDGLEDVMHLGPIWDYDTCMGNDGVAVTEGRAKEDSLFAYLLAIPAFQIRAEQLYEKYKEAFETLSSSVQSIKEQIAESAEMNYLRWDVLGKEQPKPSAERFGDSFDEAAASLEDWLKGRRRNFKITKQTSVTSVVSEDCSTMNIYFDDDMHWERVSFEVYNTDGDISLAQGYEAELVDGVWRTTVDLSEFYSIGMYRIHAYVDNNSSVYATGYNYVRVASEPDYWLEASLQDKDQLLIITLQDFEPCADISFAVWSDEETQSDLQWFKAYRNQDGIWECRVDRGLYPNAERYIIHAYAKERTFFLDGIVVRGKSMGN